MVVAVAELAVAVVAAVVVVVVAGESSSWWWSLLLRTTPTSPTAATANPSGAATVTAPMRLRAVVNGHNTR